MTDNIRSNWCIVKLLIFVFCFFASSWIVCMQDVYHESCPSYVIGSSWWPVETTLSENPNFLSKYLYQSLFFPALIYLTLVRFRTLQHIPYAPLKLDYICFRKSGQNPNAVFFYVSYLNLIKKTSFSYYSSDLYQSIFYLVFLFFSFISLSFPPFF